MGLFYCKGVILVSVQSILSLIVIVVEFVFTIIFGVMSFFMKREINQIKKTETDLSDFKLEVSNNYIRKDDYNREIHNFKKDYNRGFSEFKDEYNRSQGEVMKRMDEMQSLIIQTIKENGGR